MTKALLSISVGVFAVLLASACAGLPKSNGALVRAQAANVDRSQTDMDNDMRKRGYKPAFYRGERVYCRNEALTGSNLESKVCLTAKQIEDQERSGKDILNGNRQAGCLPTKSGCN